MSTEFCRAASWPSRTNLIPQRYLCGAGEGKKGAKASRLATAERVQEDTQWARLAQEFTNCGGRAAILLR